MPIVLQKFSIAINAGNGKVKLEEVEGSPLKNDYGLNLFVHKTTQGYKVSELSTGCSLTPSFSLKRDAIEKLHEVVKEKGIDLINEKIKHFTEYINNNKLQ